MKKEQKSKNRPRGNLFKIFKRLSGYLLEYKISVLLVSIGFIFSTLLSLALVWFVKIALDPLSVSRKNQISLVDCACDARSCNAAGRY